MIYSDMDIHFRHMIYTFPGLVSFLHAIAVYLISILIIYLFSVNTFTPIERCAIIFVIAQVGKLLIGQKIQKIKNHARCNRPLIGQ